MKKEVLFLLLLWVLPSAYALDKVLYNGWITTEKPFSVGNDTFLVTYLPDENATLVYLPGGLSAVIYAGSMNCTNEWLYTICQKGQKFQINGQDAPPTVRSNNLVISLNLLINKTDAGLSIDKSISSTVLYIGDSADIKIAIDKVGKPDVWNISYIDHFPGFNIEALTDNCKANGEDLILNAAEFDTRIVCLYRVTPSVPGIINNTAVLGYGVLDKPVTKKYSQTISVYDVPVNINMNYSKSVQLLSQNFIKIDLSIGNGSEIKEVDLSYPDKLSIFNASEEFVNENKVLILKNPKKQFYNFSYVGNFSGEAGINATIYYSHNYILSNIKKSFVLTVAPKVFDLKLIKGANSSILRISNTQNFSFMNIKMAIGTNVFDVDNLEKSRYKEFEFQNDVNATRISVAYETQFGQFLTEELSLNYSTENISTPLPVMQEPVEKVPFKITIPNPPLLVIIILILVAACFLFINSRPKKTQLDKEIDEIKKKNNFK